MQMAFTIVKSDRRENNRASFCQLDRLVSGSGFNL